MMMGLSMTIQKTKCFACAAHVHVRVAEHGAASWSFRLLGRGRQLQTAYLLNKNMDLMVAGALYPWVVQKAVVYQQAMGRVAGSDPTDRH